MKTISGAVCLLISMITPALADGIGFTRIVANDPMGGEMQVSLWYPTNKENGIVRLGPFSFAGTRDAEPAPGRRGLVVISHGTAGSDLGHRNIAGALANAGFIVAAPLHPRDNFRDDSGVGYRVVMEGRPRQVSAVVDTLLSLPRWRDRIDTKRIGGFGFSLGGYTMLAVLGAKPDMQNIVDHCTASPVDPFCDIGGNLADVMRRIIAADKAGAARQLDDPRFCAAAIADPVAVPFSDESLGGIKARHIRLWRPEDQNVLMASAHGSRVVGQLNKRGIAQTTEERVVPGAQHYSFLAPFPKSIQGGLPPELIHDSPGFDRNDFQKQFARDVAGFLGESLALCGSGD